MAVHTQFYTIRQVSEMMQTVGVSLADETAAVGTLLYDSRRVVDVTQGLFFALMNRRDGHRYIDDVYAAGVRNFVVAEGWGDSRRFRSEERSVGKECVRKCCTRWSQYN